jgi:hypothetical protein
MIEIRSEVLIKAVPSKVWSIFTDFKSFPEWNPFIRYIHGDVSPGNIIEVKISPPDAGAMVFRPKVLKADPVREIRWIGRFIIPGLFDGEHIFEVIDNHNKTTAFIQREKFTGILVPFLKKLLNNNTRRGFDSMNNKLKEKCEQ